MKIFADLHLHSKYSRATSKDLTIPNLDKYARIKGLNLLGTADFTHPDWIAELKQYLHEDGTGIPKSANGMSYVFQTEVSSIYTQDGKGRRVHNIILAPTFEIVDQINAHLAKKGNLRSDGRPIIGRYPCVDMVEDLKKISADIEIIPAHIWTPWFSVFGSMSGFNSIQDCFKDQAKHIHALETGLSSDPAMNWRLSQLDRFALISNSDSHSFWPWRIGRECNIFDFEEGKLTYKSLISALHTKNPKEFLGTVEVNPAYGKYHVDGHRLCGVSMEPKETRKHNGLCPVCGKPLTIGVLNRVEELADRPEGYMPKNAIPFYTMLPLSEVIANARGEGAVSSKKVWAIFNPLIEKFGSELSVLLDAPREELEKVVEPKVADIILKNRAGAIEVKPGYDGEYGVPVIDGVARVLNEDEANNEDARTQKSNASAGKKPQKSLFEFK